MCSTPRKSSISLVLLVLNVWLLCNQLMEQLLIRQMSVGRILHPNVLVLVHLNQLDDFVSFVLTSHLVIPGSQLLPDLINMLLFSCLGHFFGLIENSLSSLSILIFVVFKLFLQKQLLGPDFMNPVKNPEKEEHD